MMRQIQLLFLLSFLTCAASFVVMPSSSTASTSRSLTTTRMATKASDESFKKADLIDSIANLSGLTKKDSESALTALIATIQKEVGIDKKVTLPGLGSFSIKERAARKGRNPQTGEPIDIAASLSPSFTAAKPWKDALKQNKTDIV